MRVKSVLIERLTIEVPMAQREEALGWAYGNELHIVRSGPKPTRRGGISRDTYQVIAERTPLSPTVTLKLDDGREVRKLAPPENRDGQ